MLTKLTNITTGAVIILDDELYPIDEFNWSPTVAAIDYTLTGALVVHQATKLAGKPITLQSKSDMGFLTRDTLNQLHSECEKVETEYWLEYRANETIEKVKVMFDHSGQPIEANPAKDFISPYLDDLFIVTLKFIQTA